ncbi:MAG: hypothetical protein HQK54_00925 [Oligoflexales bacterium]|nr:hypothetical protein [Oligoflexales bacterium]
MVAKKEVVNTLRDPKNISGIFNYCDRWCEKCRFTNQCSCFILSALCEREAVNKEVENTVLYSIEIAFQMLRDLLSDEPMDTDFEIPEKEGNVQHLILLMSKRYLLLAIDCLKKNEMTFSEIIATDTMLAMATSENISKRILVDDIELISRYSSLIHVKLSRALMDNIEGIDDDEVDYEDRQGSAKVAILAIERSMDVWQKMSGKISKVSVVIKCLQDLLRLIEQRFPLAREFLRPGFDIVKQ